MRIGIFGGSFNPVHRAHLELARHARESLNLDRIEFVVAKRSPFKNHRELLPLALRVRLVREAIRPFSAFRLSLYETRKNDGRPSYTVDTLRHFRDKYGAGAVLYFICGADAALGMPKWKHAREIPKLCRVAVFSRYGVRRPARLAEGALYIPWESPDLSATQIRRRLLECRRKGLVEKRLRGVKMRPSKGRV